jgi:hypothetical protein
MPVKVKVKGISSNPSSVLKRRKPVPLWETGPSEVGAKK